VFLGSASYELRPDVILQAFATRVQSNYPGIGRADTGPGAGVKWLLDRNVSMNVLHSYSHRSSSAPLQEYSGSVISLGLNAHIQGLPAPLSPARTNPF